MHRIITRHDMKLILECHPPRTKSSISWSDISSWLWLLQYNNCLAMICVCSYSSIRVIRNTSCGSIWIRTEGTIYRSIVCQWNVHWLYFRASHYIAKQCSYCRVLCGFYMRLLIIIGVYAKIVPCSSLFNSRSRKVKRSRK